jgi:HAD superfamily hydrolase (TIGR01493 family)
MRPCAATPATSGRTAAPVGNLARQAARIFLGAQPHGQLSRFLALTQDALDFAFKKVPSADPALRQRLLDTYWSLDCYPEVPAVLKALKAQGARLAILSNGSPAMLESAVKAARWTR